MGVVWWVGRKGVGRNEEKGRRYIGEEDGMKDRRRKKTSLVLIWKWCVGQGEERREGERKVRRND